MKIGIIGASSQVGSSVAFYMSRFMHAEIKCFIRSDYSKVFFELFDIPVLNVSYQNKTELTEQLKDIDLVVDCAYPGGQLYEIPATIKLNSEAIIAAMQPGAAYMYMSSIMAYGMPGDQKFIEDYIIPRSSYAHIKRTTEKLVKDLCMKYSVKLYIFRLGQVHGFLQSVSSSFKEKLSAQPIFYVDGNEDDVTNTIFISALCEAILKCAEGKQVPGLYTLVSSPQWTLKELYGYYLHQYNILSEIKFVPYQQPVEGNKIRGKIMSFVKKHRPLLETYVLMKNPALSVKLKGKHRQNEAASAAHEQLTVTYPDINLLGKPKHATVNGLDYSVNNILMKEKEMELFYREKIEKMSNEF